MVRVFVDVEEFYGNRASWSHDEQLQVSDLFSRLALLFSAASGTGAASGRLDGRLRAVELGVGWYALTSSLGSVRIVHGIVREVGAMSWLSSYVQRRDELDVEFGFARDGLAEVADPQELLSLVDPGRELWRLRLHPAQADLVTREFSGSAAVIGGPGTGKTVVAVHRAAALARRLRGGQKVLVTTYTKTLAVGLRGAIAMLDDKAAARRIEVRTIDGLVRGLLRAGQARPVVDAVELRGLWQQAAQAGKLGGQVDFVMKEYREIIVPQGISDFEAYRNADRGRRARLSETRRWDLWRAVSWLRRELARRGESTFDGACVEVARQLGRASIGEYAHVIVDEAQDMSAVQWRVIRALVRPGANDIFIAGDSFQRIYANEVDPTSEGVDVSGQIHALAVNYRSTQEVIAFSTRLLGSISVRDFVGVEEKISASETSVVGSAPVWQRFGTCEEEAEGAARQVRRWLRDGVRPEEIGVAARSIAGCEYIAKFLRANGIACMSVGSDRDVRLGEVVVATMHRMKGLEFRCVAMVGVTSASFPHRHVTSVFIDQYQHVDETLRQRLLLFVAATRARSQLYVSWSGRPSEFLAPVLSG